LELIYAYWYTRTYQSLTAVVFVVTGWSTSPFFMQWSTASYQYLTATPCEVMKNATNNSVPALQTALLPHAVTMSRNNVVAVLFTDRMTFLSPNQQRQSTDGKE